MPNATQAKRKYSELAFYKNLAFIGGLFYGALNAYRALVGRLDNAEWLIPVLLIAIGFLLNHGIELNRRLDDLEKKIADLNVKGHA